ncbi:MAG TPA: sigma 54-interacting transcriptional regulator [Sandaracinaceae bacterium LLY-WYZ-13_1]|nr:sigma 54-interacting transcriptional regulator [Sandaracinaceae bacterium LLY-WYZ-13_1]
MPRKGDETWELEVEKLEDVGVVTVVDGPDAGLEVELEGEEVTVGTSEAATVRLSDPTVSRLHVSLRHEPGKSSDGLRVRDLGSKNGTFVGPLRLHEGVVSAGTHLRLGSTELELGIRPGVVRRAVWDGGDRLGALVGGAPAMHQLFAALTKVAGTDSRVLLLGESGTGKELAARTLHTLGRRKGGPFVVVDAAAMADTLVEDELFGHERGAFTGAVETHPGAFERADGGTIFLDEIGDLPLALQAKLLRVLEEGTVQRLGGTERISVDVRVIAATHKPLARMVNERTFREDLYYRLAVIELRLPPLRQRMPDVPVLARHILAQDDRLDDETVAAVEQALEEHRGYAWPGNVRELRNFVRRVAVLGPAHAQLMPADRAPRVRADLDYHHAKDLWLELFEREYVSRVLHESGGNVSKAARRSGLSRVHLGNLIARHRLKERIPRG